MIALRGYDWASLDDSPMGKLLRLRDVATTNRDGAGSAAAVASNG